MSVRIPPQRTQMILMALANTPHLASRGYLLAEDYHINYNILLPRNIDWQTYATYRDTYEDVENLHLSERCSVKSTNFPSPSPMLHSSHFEEWSR